MNIVSALATLLLGSAQVAVGFLLFQKFRKNNAGLFLLLGFCVPASSALLSVVFQIMGKDGFLTYGIPSIIGFILVLVGALQLPLWQKKDMQPLQGVTVSRVSKPYPVAWAGLALAGLLVVSELFIIISLFSTHGMMSGLFKNSANLILALTAAIYFYICLFRIHKNLNEATNGTHPVSPGMAVGFHFIPFYNLYWFFKWTNDIVRFIKSRNPSSRMPIGLMGVLMLLGAFGGWIPVKDDLILGQSYMWMLWFLVLTILTAQVEKVAVYSTDASTEAPINEGA